MATNRFLTVKETSEILRLTEKTIYMMLENGTIPGSQIGRVWRVDWERLEEKFFKGQQSK